MKLEEIDEALRDLIHMGRSMLTEKAIDILLKLKSDILKDEK